MTENDQLIESVIEDLSWLLCYVTMSVESEKEKERRTKERIQKVLLTISKLKRPI